MTLIRIDNLDDPRLDVYRKLTNHQLRNATEIEQGIFICESQIALRVAIENNTECLSLLLDENKLEAMSDVVDKIDDSIPIFVVTTEMSEQITGYKVIRGALGAFVRPHEPSIDDVLRNSEKICVLEGLVDASNVGSIFRNAAALGIDAVVVAPTCADPLCRRSVRVSMGTVLQIPFVHAQDNWPDDFFNKLDTHGFYSLALALKEDSINLNDPIIKEHKKVAMFFGCEGFGLTKSALDKCSQTVLIPMHHDVDSLNVAAASAITFWELCKCI